MIQFLEKSGCWSRCLPPIMRLNCVFLCNCYQQQWSNKTQLKIVFLLVSSNKNTCCFIYNVTLPKRSLNREIVSTCYRFVGAIETLSWGITEQIKSLLPIFGDKECHHRFSDTILRWIKQASFIWTIWSVAFDAELQCKIAIWGRQITKC